MKRIITFLTSICVAAAASADNSRYVNLFMGTAGDHGQVTPGAQMPMGLTSVCPDSRPGQHAGYDYEVPEISGISVNRMSGTGGAGGGGNVRILPATPGTKVCIVKGTEKAVPGYYETALDNGVKVFLTASKHCAIERYVFPKDGDKVLFVDFDSAIDHRRNECSSKQLSDRTFEGWVKSSTVCNFGVYKNYWRLWTSVPFSAEVAEDGKTAVLRFDPSVREVEVRVGLSSIDEDSAGAELSAIAGKSFSTLRKEAAKAWSRVLGLVDVKGSTLEQRKLFYTSLYRVYLSPFDATFSGMYRGTDGLVRTASDWTFMSGWSMWDTYRAKFPIITLLDPDAASDICRSLVSLYKTGKLNWATMNEPTLTVRTEHSQITLLDAWVKGVRGFDMAEAFPAMEAEADEGHKPGARNGLTRNAPDQKMETIYDLWAMGQIAGIIGNKEAAKRYGEEAETFFEQVWKKEFMTITPDFVRMRGNGMYQGTRWQYRWAMPVFADKMKEWVGEEELASQLSEFFDRHLFNQGNEPDIQTPFMFNLFGHPERTDSLVHALLTDEKMIHLYGGNAEYPEPFVGRAFRDRLDGYAPEMDEDDGTMSGWYMFCQMGLYPVCLGTDRYELFTPLFKKIVLHLKDHDVTIVRKCDPASAGGVEVDGRRLPGFSISHKELTGAKKIVYVQQK